MRKPFIAANWKMYKTTKEAVDFVQAFEEMVVDLDMEIVVCPPFTALKSVYTVMWQDSPNFKLGAQNMFWEEEGAFTGEVSPSMLQEIGVDYVIVGHSERRQYFNETDETVNNKVRAALAHDLLPIMCCGESLELRQQGKAMEWVRNQITAGLEGLSLDDLDKLVIAYEPIWAIGTGKTATDEDANKMNENIRSAIAAAYGDKAAKGVPVLYGGSVKPDNIGEFMSMPQVDGALVGGASLKPETFAAICKNSIV
ncbi:MAG: triose-phosphate isomerase [Candidatus Aquicultorales bacterium]